MKGTWRIYSNFVKDAFTLTDHERLMSRKSQALQIKVSAWPHTFEDFREGYCRGHAQMLSFCWMLGQFQCLVLKPKCQWFITDCKPFNHSTIVFSNLPSIEVTLMFYCDGLKIHQVQQLRSFYRRNTFDQCCMKHWVQVVSRHILITQTRKIEVG